MWPLKYAASFLKSDWNVGDYPLRFRRQGTRSDTLAVATWRVQIVRWPQMCGLGDTKQSALEDLQKRLDAYRQNRLLPRPGTQVALEFASTRHIDAYDQIARDFLAKILDIDFDRCFISDQSSLSDFRFDKASLNGLYGKIREVYGIDATDLREGNLLDIFERIRVARGQ